MGRRGSEGSRLLEGGGECYKQLKEGERAWSRKRPSPWAPPTQSCDVIITILILPVLAFFPYRGFEAGPRLAVYDRGTPVLLEPLQPSKFDPVDAFCEWRSVPCFVCFSDAGNVVFSTNRVTFNVF